MTTVVTTSPYVLAAGEVLVAVDEDALRLQSAAQNPPSITVAGAVRVSVSPTVNLPYSTISGVRVGDGGLYNTTVQVEATGSVTVDASAGVIVAFGINASSWAPAIVNAGTVSVTARADVYGIASGGVAATLPGAAVINSGTVRAVSTEGSAIGVWMPSGDGFANAGLIEVTGAQLAYGVQMRQWGSSFLNTGTIRATDGDPAVESVAVFLHTTITGGFVNTGSIQGEYALKFVDYNSPQLADWAVPAPTVFENFGRMVGKVDLGHYRQVLINAGSIEGDVQLGSGDDTYSGRDGTVSGLVSGGEGADNLAGGAAFDYLQGALGADTVSGNGADDWLLGGQGNDLLDGGAGADLLYGNLGDDWCDGWTGDDLIRGGQGADRVFGQAGNDWLSGDRGDDTLTGGAGADIFHSFAEAGIDRVTDFSAADGDRVQLDPGTAYTLAQVGADTVIDMGGGNRVVLVNVQLSALPEGWIVGG